ncbi:hypothetical protein ACOME3_005501 [Neoechinorhynchus agilis]
MSSGSSACESSNDDSDIALSIPPRLLADAANLKLSPLKYLGSGSFSHVILVQFEEDSVKQNGALKIIISDSLKSTSHGYVRRIQSELRILRKVNHLYIIKMYKAFIYRSYICMLFEPINTGIDLFTLTRRYAIGPEKSALPLKICIHILSQITFALSYLHARRIIYRDLKPENVVNLDANGLIKLVDFGFAKELPPGGKAYSRCGTLVSMAPEIHAASGYTNKIDCWALGVLIYELIGGFNPFENSTGKLNFLIKQFPAHMDRFTVSLILNLTAFDPNILMAFNV